MSLYSKEMVNMHKSQIRRLLAVNHHMPLREMQTILGKNGYTSLTLDYINSLREKVLKERVHFADRATLKNALADFASVLTETSRIAWSIALDGQADNREKISAIKEIRETHKDLFDKLFDAGVFDRRLGTLNSNVTNTTVVISEKTADRYGEQLKQIADILRGTVANEKADGN